MKSIHLVLLYMLGVFVKKVSLCELLQECTNCKAAQSCGSYREMKTNVTKCECIDMLETAGTLMVEFDTNQGTCKSFNMCQGRQEAMGFNAFIKSCRTDCLQYTIETRIDQSGSCFETSRTAVGITHACLQFCLHRDGCMAITHLTYSSGTIICTFHNGCTQSVPEPTNNSTFIGITCSGIGVTSIGNLPCHISQTSQAPTTTSPILTLIQTTFASSETPLSSTESGDSMTSVTVHATSAPSVTTSTSAALSPVSSSGIGVTSIENLPRHTSQTSQGPTTNSPTLTLIQTTFASSETSLSSAESWDLSTSGIASASMTTTVPKTIPSVSLSSYTTNITLVMISTVSSPGGTIKATANTSLHGKDDFFSKPSNIAAVSAAGGVAVVGGLSASACLMMKKLKLTKTNIN